MPLVDMTLDELIAYQGSSPCPPDIDAYWDKALAEMRNVKADVELRPAMFRAMNAECFDLWFTGVGGARVHAKYLRPSLPQDRCPVILQFHGYSGSCGQWHDKLAWVSQGFAIAALDCRGQGGLSEDVGGVKGTTYQGHIVRGLDDSPEKLLFRSIFLDTAQLASIVMGFPETDAGRVGAMGGSQGGGLTLACAALEPRITRLAPCYPFLCDYRRVWQMDLAMGAYAELKTFFRHFDPLHEREDEIFARLGYIDVQNLAKRIRGETLMGVGLMDTTCPPSTQFAAFNKITAPKSYEIYPDFGHEGLPGFEDRVFAFMQEL